MVAPGTTRAEANVVQMWRTVVYAATNGQRVTAKVQVKQGVGRGLEPPRRCGH
jgi:hypothetical protein